MVDLPDFSRPASLSPFRKPDTLRSLAANPYPWLKPAEAGASPLRPGTVAGQLSFLPLPLSIHARV